MTSALSAESAAMGSSNESLLIPDYFSQPSGLGYSQRYNCTEKAGSATDASGCVNYDLQRSRVPQRVADCGAPLQPKTQYMSTDECYNRTGLPPEYSRQDQTALSSSDSRPSASLTLASNSVYHCKPQPTTKTANAEHKAQLSARNASGVSTVTYSNHALTNSCRHEAPSTAPTR